MKFKYVLFLSLLTVISCNNVDNNKEENSADIAIKEQEAYEEYLEVDEEPIEIISWDGGPSIFPEEKINELYTYIFTEGINSFYISEEDNAMIMFGQYTAPACHGIYGLSHYTSLQKAIHRFNIANNLSSKPDLEDLDWGDLSYVTDFIGIDLFDNKKQEREGFDFRCLNPEVIKWLHENLIPEPTDELDDKTYQDIYNALGSRYFRTTMESYIYLKANNPKLSIDEYRNATQEEDVNGINYLSDNYSLAFEDYPIYRAMELDYLTPETAIGYWLRRFMDGSAKEFYNAHYKVISKYDSEWLSAKLIEYNLEGYELHLGPGEDLMQMHHIANIFPVSNSKGDPTISFSCNELSSSDMKEGDPNAYITALYHTEKNSFISLMANEIDKPQLISHKASFGNRYQLNDYDLLTFSFSNEQNKFLFAFVFNNDKVQPQPLLLGFEVEKEEIFYRQTSELSINDDGDLLVNDEIVSFVKKGEKEKNKKTLSESKLIIKQATFLPFEEVY